MQEFSADKAQLNIPNHIAIIADGNRRWAKAHNVPSLEGHKRGAENIETLMDVMKRLGVKCYSTWIFSTENWKRSEKEIEYLFTLARQSARGYQEKCINEKIKFVHLGRKDRLPKDIVDIIVETEEKTKDFDGMIVAVGMDYGGHDEIVRAIKKLLEQGMEITEENIENNLDTAVLPKPDLIIRPSGEVRLSGFMSWQSAYAELYFPEVAFPDFDENQLMLAIQDYTNRDRRFGGNSNKA